jgi:hypothetical protein
MSFTKLVFTLGCGLCAALHADIIEGGEVNRTHPSLYAYYQGGEGLDYDPGTGIVGSWNNLSETTGDPFLQDLYRVIGEPLRVSNAINGHPAIGFGGAEGLWSPRDEFGEVFQPNTYFAVTYAAADTLSDYIFDSSTSAARNAMIMSPTNNEGNWSLYAGVDHSSAEPVALEEWQIHAVVFDGASSAHYINGELAYTADVGDQNLWGLILGARYTGGNNLVGSIAEFAVYDERLSDDDRGAVEQYLSDKYAIPLGADCPPDYNGDGVVNSQDFVAFLNDFVAGDPGADYNGDGVVNSQDFVSFLNDFVAGC